MLASATERGVGQTGGPAKPWYTAVTDLIHADGLFSDGP